METRVASGAEQGEQCSMRRGDQRRRVINETAHTSACERFSEVSELLIGPGRQVQPGTACLL